MNTEDTIARMERELAAALADCDNGRCSGYLTDEFAAITGVEGEQLRVTLRAEWLNSVAAGSTQRFKIDDIAVSVHGSVGVATMLWVEEGTLGSTHWLITDIWTKAGGGDWRVAERHSGRPSPKIV